MEFAIAKEKNVLIMRVPSEILEATPLCRLKRLERMKANTSAPLF